MDLTRLARRLGVDGASEVFVSFLDTLPRRLSALDTALRGAGAGEIERAVHDFVGVCSIVGAYALESLVRRAGSVGNEEEDERRRLGAAIHDEADAVARLLEGFVANRP